MCGFTSSSYSSPSSFSNSSFLKRIRKIIWTSRQARKPSPGLNVLSLQMCVSYLEQRCVQYYQHVCGSYYPRHAQQSHTLKCTLYTVHMFTVQWTHVYCTVYTCLLFGVYIFTEWCTHVMCTLYICLVYTVHMFTVRCTHVYWAVYTCLVYTVHMFSVHCTHVYCA